MAKKVKLKKYRVLQRDENGVGLWWSSQSGDARAYLDVAAGVLDVEGCIPIAVVEQICLDTADHMAWLAEQEEDKEITDEN